MIRQNTKRPVTTGFGLTMKDVDRGPTRCDYCELEAEARSKACVFHSFRAQQDNQRKDAEKRRAKLAKKKEGVS